MKPSSRSLHLQIVAIAVALSFGLPAFAESPREEVAHAFHLLKKADRDYDGHRMKAIEDVEAAGHTLGLDLGGEVLEGERHWKSDKQLMEARRLLREARTKLERADRDRVAERLDKAIKEIDISLAIK